MESFVAKLVGMVTTLAALFIVMGRINHARLKQLDGKITAAYSAPMKWLVVLGYGVIAFMPLLIASSLKEGNPIADRTIFAMIHALFFTMILWSFNRRIVIGASHAGVSDMFGITRIISNSDLATAVLSKSRLPVFPQQIL